MNLFCLIFGHDLTKWQTSDGNKFCCRCKRWFLPKGPASK